MVMNIHCKISMDIDEITKQYEHECHQKCVHSKEQIAVVKSKKLQGVLSET